MFVFWLRQSLFVASTSLLLFLAYCLVALWLHVARLVQRFRRPSL